MIVKKICSLRLVWLLSLATSLAGLAWWLAVVYAHSTYFDGFSANGAFQMLNPLRRLADGQVPGKDFLVFHGIGNVWLHLPLFWLFGQTLQASEISRYVVSGSCHIILSLGLILALRKRADVKSATLAGLMLFMAGPLFLHSVFLPASSILGVRTFFGLLLPLALLGSRGIWIPGILFGLSMITSIEQGMATMLALFATVISAVARGESRHEGKRNLLVFVIGIAIFALLLVLATSGHAKEMLKFYLIDIPTDQYWFIGAPPNWFLPDNWQVLYKDKIYLAFGVLLALSCVITGKALRRNSPLALFHLYLLVFASFGLISQLSYLAPTNLHPQYRALLILLLAEVATSAQTELRNKRFVYMLIFLAFSVKLKGGHMDEPLTLAPTGHKEFLSEYWTNQVKAVRLATGDGALWSSYAGLTEASLGRFHPSTDYIIHSLGPAARKQYVEDFSRVNPTAVRLDNVWGWDYGHWLLNTRWDIYSKVFAGYRLAFHDKWVTLWVHDTALPTRSTISSQTLMRADGCLQIRKPLSSPPEILEATIDYQTRNAFDRLPIIGKSPHFLLDIRSDGTLKTSVPLPPTPDYSGHLIFPVIAQGNMTTLCPRTASILPGAKLEVKSILINAPLLSESARQYLTAPL